MANPDPLLDELRLISAMVDNLDEKKNDTLKAYAMFTLAACSVVESLTTFRRRMLAKDEIVPDEYHVILNKIDDRLISINADIGAQFSKIADSISPPTAGEHHVR